MAFDEKLADRIRDALNRRKGISEKKMFGGLCFLLNGNMVFGIVKDEIMVRVGPDQYERALKRKHCREMDFTGKPMNGYVYVGRDGIRRADSLKSWLELGLAFGRTLPRKEKK
jgi:TfoX/Sxy family transcriptional regulator of competence genes